MIGNTVEKTMNAWKAEAEKFTGSMRRPNHPDDRRVYEDEMEGLRELLPCPFCGAILSGGKMRHQSWCILVWYSSWDAASKDVISSWNTRATDQHKDHRCKCSMRTSLVGDGCRYCNPQYYIDMLEELTNESATCQNTSGLMPIAHMDAYAEAKRKYKPLFDAALSWWEGKRPVAFAAEDHASNPTVNCVTDREKELAIEIARIVKGGEDGRERSK